MPQDNAAATEDIPPPSEASAAAPAGPEPAAAAAASVTAAARLRRYAPLAASIALAAALGALGGAAATSRLLDEPLPPAVTAADSARALQQTMARMEEELAMLRAGVSASARSAGAQFGKLAERIERAEKAQAEPAAKIARIAESLDRLELRLPKAAAQAPEITGSVAAQSEAKPAVAEGWELLDLFGGRAVVENRAGRVFEVGPGSNLPGLGRVEAVRREDGRVVVVTRKGIIAAPVERRRARHSRPYWD
jgi:hypothetical protein